LHKFKRGKAFLFLEKRVVEMGIAVDYKEKNKNKDLDSFFTEES